jgi:hypothetical protein
VTRAHVARAETFEDEQRPDTALRNGASALIRITETAIGLIIGAIVLLGSGAMGYLICCSSWRSAILAAAAIVGGALVVLLVLAVLPR